MEFLRNIAAVFFLAAITSVAYKGLPFTYFMLAILTTERIFLLLGMLSVQMIYL